MHQVDDALLQRLRKAVGTQRVLTEPERLAPYLKEERRIYQGVARAVVQPATTQEVAEVVRLCAAAGVPVVPQGGNTGACGGAVPQHPDAIVVSTERLNRVRTIDVDNMTLTAEAGCILAHLQQVAQEAGCFLPLSLGGEGSCRIGGNLSTNAGGINVLRFGNTRDQVLGLEVVLPDGRIWNGLRALRKDSSGYDLKHLFIGAEGTLGIITKAVMRLHPRPLRDQTMYASVGDVDRLMELFALARSVGDTNLTAFELIPGHMVDKAIAKYPVLVRPMETRAEWYVLVRFSGGEDITDKLETFFGEAHERSLLTDATLAQNLAQEKNLWDLRDEIPPLKLMTGKMLKWDTSVPIDRIIPFLAECEKVACAIHPPSKVIAFGHVGDGNLHMSIWPEGVIGEHKFDKLCKDIVSAIDDLIWQYGGSICAEHGVGVENYDRVRGQKSPLEFEMMAKIKALFDPKGLFNPGKTFDPAYGEVKQAAE